MSNEQDDATRPGTAGSDSTKTQISSERLDTVGHENDQVVSEKEKLHGGEGQSAIPEDTKVRCFRHRFMK